MKIKAVENETHPSMETSKPVGNRGHEEDRGGSWLGAWKPNRREQGRPLHSESVRIIRGIWGQEKAKRQGPPGDTLTLSVPSQLCPTRHSLQVTHRFPACEPSTVAQLCPEHWVSFS